MDKKILVGLSIGAVIAVALLAFFLLRGEEPVVGPSAGAEKAVLELWDSTGSANSFNLFRLDRVNYSELDSLQKSLEDDRRLMVADDAPQYSIDLVDIYLLDLQVMKKFVEFDSIAQSIIVGLNSDLNSGCDYMNDISEALLIEQDLLAKVKQLNDKVAFFKSNYPDKTILLDKVFLVDSKELEQEFGSTAKALTELRSSCASFRA